MTDYIKMAVDAGVSIDSLGWTYTSGTLSELLERFAQAVKEHCAQIVEADMVPDAKTPYQRQYNAGIAKLAEKIRG